MHSPLDLSSQHLHLACQWLPWTYLPTAHLPTCTPICLSVCLPPALPPAPGPSCRVAFVLLEDFEQGDPRGITDTLEAGVREGQ